VLTPFSRSDCRFQFGDSRLSRRPSRPQRLQLIVSLREGLAEIANVRIPGCNNFFMLANCKSSFLCEIEFGDCRFANIMGRGVSFRPDLVELGKAASSSRSCSIRSSSA
jgi:hypothetical protein